MTIKYGDKVLYYPQTSDIDEFCREGYCVGRVDSKDSKEKVNILWSTECKQHKPDPSPGVAKEPEIGVDVKNLFNLSDHGCV